MERNYAPARRAYVGWDFHKRKSYVVVMRENGEVIEERKIENRDVLSLRGFLLGLERGTPVAVEATGNWYWLIDLLEEYGLKPYMAHPKNTKVIVVSKCKTDRIDAKVLADLLRTNFLPTAYIPSPKVRELRELLRTRIFLVREKTKIKNRIHSVLNKLGIFLDYSDIFGRRGRREIRNLDLGSPYKEEIDILLDSLESIEAKVIEIESILRRIEVDRGWRDDLRLLQTVPGIGWFSGLLILAEIGDIDRFRSPRALCSYAGLVPSTYQSGERRWSGKITKEGSRWLRWIMVEAATKAVSINDYYKDFYEKLKKKKGKQVAKVAVARKMLVGVYYILKKKEPFKNGRGEG